MQRLSQVIRTFNRFELKYLLSIRQAQEFKNDLLNYLTPDENGDDGGVYGVASLYFDSPDLRCYREKIDGIRFRRKLRIRQYYHSPGPLPPEKPVFIEVKQRINRVTQKRRVCMPYKEALHLCLKRPAWQWIPGDNPVIAEILSMNYWYNLQPVSVVTFTRQALVGGDLDIGLRVTFDRDLRYRVNNLDLAAQEQTSDYLFPPQNVIMEIKVNERVPYWLTELAAQHNLNLVRVSKYCRSIEEARMEMTAAAPSVHNAEILMDQENFLSW